MESMIAPLWPYLGHVKEMVAKEGGMLDHMSVALYDHKWRHFWAQFNTFVI